MRSLLSLILIYCLTLGNVFAQSVNPNDQVKIGNKVSSSDKGIVFDTNDGINNKKLLIEKISKKLKYDGNSLQIGDGSSSSDKEIIIAGALKSLKYNGTTGEFEFNDDLKLFGELKTDILRAINTEVAIKSLLRAEQGIKVGTGSNEIRVNAGNLEFSNDGVLYKKFGTGTANGGSTGTSILDNSSFEDGVTTNWSNTGGTLSQQTYTNGVEGDLKYARFIATTSGQYLETSLKAIPTNFSGGCQADFKKVNVSANDLFKVEVLDSSANVLSSGNVKLSSWSKFPTINFTCPSAGTQIRLRVTSLAAGTIELDNAYLGSNQNIVNVGSANFYGSIKYGFASGQVWSTTSTSFANFTANASMATPSVTGKASATATKIPAIKFSRLPKGTYQIVASGMMFGTSSNTTAWRFFDGTNASTVGTTYVSATGAGNMSPATMTFRYDNSTDQNDVTLNLQAAVNAGTSYIDVGNATYYPEFSISVYYYPTEQDIAVSPEQASWHIDANIGGGNVSLGTGAISSYTEVSFSSYDMVINSNKGSASAEIPCITTNASTGLTCSSSNESLGIAFVPPSSGLYEACFDFSTEFGNINTQHVVYQLVETPNNAQTILQEGGIRLQSGGTSASSAPSSNPSKVCGTFNFSDTSKKTIRLMYEKIATVGNPNLLGDRDGTAGQRDIHVTVRPLLSAFNRPILVGGSNVTPGLTSSSVDSFSVSFGTTNATTQCSASPCSYFDQVGTGATSMTRVAQGSYALNFASSYSKMKCVGTIQESATATTQLTPTLNCTSCNSVSFQTINNSGLNRDAYGTLFCQGVK